MASSQNSRLNKHDLQIHKFQVPVVHHTEGRHMDWADLDLMVRPLDREDRLVDMDPVLLVGSLEFIILYYGREHLE